MRIRARKVKCMRLAFEFADGLSERLGGYGGWSLAGGIDLSVVVWLVEFLARHGELPGDAAPTWVWPDPSYGCLLVLIYSDSYDVVPEATEAPLVHPVVDRHKLDRAMSETAGRHGVALGFQNKDLLLQELSRLLDRFDFIPLGQVEVRFYQREVETHKDALSDALLCLANDDPTVQGLVQGGESERLAESDGIAIHDTEKGTWHYSWDREVS